MKREIVTLPTVDLPKARKRVRNDKRGKDAQRQMKLEEFFASELKFCFLGIFYIITLMRNEKEKTDNVYTFFSIIVPAHNEEHYIGKTLLRLKEINYPREKFEVIVVENGSNDKTIDEINKYDSFKAYSLKERGVSKAKNLGASKVSKDSQWLIFLDADTYLGNSFLKHLNRLLLDNKEKNFQLNVNTNH